MTLIKKCSRDKTIDFPSQSYSVAEKWMFNIFRFLVGVDQLESGDVFFILKKSGDGKEILHVAILTGRRYEDESYKVHNEVLSCGGLGLHSKKVTLETDIRLFEAWKGRGANHCFYRRRVRKGLALIIHSPIKNAWEEIDSSAAKKIQKLFRMKIRKTLKRLEKKQNFQIKVGNTQQKRPPFYNSFPCSIL